MGGAQPELHRPQVLAGFALHCPDDRCNRVALPNGSDDSEAERPVLMRLRRYRFNKGALVPFCLFMFAVSFAAVATNHLLGKPRNYALGFPELAFAIAAVVIVRLGTRRQWFGWQELKPERL
jgi:hypothetical protein